MSLFLAYLAVASSLLSAVLALGGDRHPLLVRAGCFGLLGVTGLCATAAGITVLASGIVVTDQLPLGLPWLPWHVRLDALSGLFMAIVGLVVLAVTLYGPGYLREYQHGRQPLSVLGLFSGLFVAGMLMVLMADDSFAFMIAWELMSLASYFLVAYQHQHPANRRAAFLYLLMAHMGALAILLGFGVLAASASGLTFDALRAAPLSATWATIAFVLALIGFGMKAGLVPVHAWLPEAHPVAPSHISALMSAVMLKVAVYGLIRFCFDLLGSVQWQWGLTLLLAGSASALLGALYALMQNDLKRLLAYSSVENIGIIFMALGLAMIFAGTGHPRLAALGLIAALYHALNHALFKGLLFLGAGTVLQRSHQRDISLMGGLIRRMPVTAVLFLVGCVAIAGLPPLNGFASEWLTFQAALQATALESGVLRTIIPVTAALLALTSALAAAAFVKVYGIAFLGQARSRQVKHAREGDLGMQAALGWLATLCLLAGTLPTVVVQGLEPVPALLLGHALPSASSHGWLWLTPVRSEVASYSAPLVVSAILLAWGIGYWALHRRGVAVARRAAPWDCGFGTLSPRMQYTSGAFTMPLGRIFRPVWQITEQVEESTAPHQPLVITAIRHQLLVADRSWAILYEPIARGVLKAARSIGRIQTGRVRTYLGYSFLTLLVLLWLIT